MAKTEIPSNTYTLADLTAATRRRLGPTKFVLGDDVEVELPSIFRLPKELREKIWDSLKEINKLGDDTDDEETGYALLVEATKDALLLVTADAAKIVEAVAENADGDVLLEASLLGEILGYWMENTQAGEA
jgi:hypothetical protein